MIEGEQILRGIRFKMAKAEQRKEREMQDDMVVSAGQSARENDQTPDSGYVKQYVK